MLGRGGAVRVLSYVLGIEGGLVCFFGTGLVCVVGFGVTWCDVAVLGIGGASCFCIVNCFLERGQCLIHSFQLSVDCC